MYGDAQMLTIFPKGGLCNRLLALHSAIALAADVEQPLRVVWTIGPDLGCPFERLFERPLEIAELITIRRLHETLGDRAREIVKRYLRWPPMHPTLFPSQVTAKTEQGYDFRELGLRRNSVIAAYNFFYPGTRGFYPFTPVEDVRRSVAEVTGRFGNTIGVHIRRGDHTTAIASSSTEAFERRMREIVRIDPDTSFFVASDDRREVENMKMAFPGKIIDSGAPSFARDEAEGIKAAVVDLYALAGTRRILGSVQSTFSQGAGLIGGIEVENIKSRENATPRA